MRPGYALETACAAAMALFVVAGRADAAPAAPAAPETAPVAVTAGELADHPDRYMGRVVIVRADVEDVYSPTVFTLDEDRLWSTGEDVLVIADGLKHRVHDGLDVTVVGKVVPYDETAIGRRLDGYAPDATAGLLSAFGHRPVIVAQSIRNAFGDELARAGGAADGSH